MIREDEFVLSRRQYAIDLDSFRARDNWGYVTAVWYRRKKSVTRACIGQLRDRQQLAPATVQQFLAAYDEDAWGGKCWARWDGTEYWGDGVPQRMREYMELLEPMLRDFPKAPDGFDGWWRF